VVLAILSRALGAMIDLRDKRTGEHCLMVGELAVATAAVLGLPAHECRLIRFGGQMHDLGKIAIPDRLLHNSDGLKPGELAPDDRHRLENGDTAGRMTIQAMNAPVPDLPA